MEDQLQQNHVDYVVSAAKAVLGSVPFAGSLLAELAGTVIPKQRIDRLAAFARELEANISALDQNLVRVKLSDENFTDLLEETARQATQAVSEDRRKYLASIVVNGVTQDHVSFIESKHLLRILGQINDIEVIWLRFYSNPLLSGDDIFRQRHAAILEPILVSMSSDSATIDRASLQESYADHLVALRLLERPLLVDSKTGLPSFDKRTGSWKTRGVRTTSLGQLLLRHIGLSATAE